MVSSNISLDYQEPLNKIQKTSHEEASSDPLIESIFNRLDSLDIRYARRLRGWGSREGMAKKVNYSGADRFIGPRPSESQKIIRQFKLQFPWNLTPHNKLLAIKLLDTSISSLKRPILDHRTDARKDANADMLTIQKELSQRTKNLLPKSPYKVLDAPGLFNDFYSNPIDCSNNLFASSLDTVTYCINLVNSKSSLQKIRESQDRVLGVKWINHRIALGTEGGKIELYNVEAERLEHTIDMSSMFKKIYTFTKIDRSTFLFSGYVDKIFKVDLRVAKSIVCTLDSGFDRACSLSVSSDHRYIAAGGNNNQVRIWSSDLINKSAPLHVLNTNAAIKALQWSPTKSNLLAFGGGADDKILRIWDNNHQKYRCQVATDSQICNLHWLSKSQRIITTHGFVTNEIAMWHVDLEVNQLTKISQANGHQDRTLYSTLKEDESLLVTGSGGDETFCLWKIPMHIHKSRKQEQFDKFASLHRYEIR